MKSNYFQFVLTTVILIQEISSIECDPCPTGVSESSLSVEKAEHRNRRQASENVCAQLCTCTEEKLMVVRCDLTESRDYTLDGRYYIPSEAVSITINLGSRTHLVLKHDLFLENRNFLNRFFINGNENGQENVEIGEKAFCGNNGSYPEIEIYNCHTVTFRENSICKESALNVTSSNEVNIFSRAFPIETCRVHLNNIEDLRMQERAFEGSITTMIHISKCKLHAIKELKASFREFKVTDSTIEVISSKAFDVNSIGSLIFDNCKIKTLQSQAIPEKFLCKYFSMENCDVEEMQKDFITGCGLNNFTLRGNRISNIESKAIKFTGVKSTIVRNKIISAGDNWLELVDVWSNLTIYNNTFGSFGYMTLPNHETSTCSFERNFITEAKPGSFKFPAVCEVKDISFHNHCSCDSSWLANLKYKNLRELQKESHCQINDTLRFCFNATIVNLKKYLDQVCSNSSTVIDCLKSQQSNRRIEGEFISPEEIESNQYKFKLIYIVIIAAAAIILVILLVLVVRKMFVKSEISHHIPNDISSVSSYHISDKTLKTFSKDDKQIINQTLEKIKEKQSPEKYDQIYNNTRKLLNGNFTETEKVLTIGEIVRCLGECENTGDDFVAFTDILYKHLAPTTNTVTESEYAEPLALMNQSNEGTTNLPDNEMSLDHIYAELTCAQQPLLVNEYAAPADISDALYSEPVQTVNKEINARSLITPYAIGNTNQQPDILNLPSTTSFKHITRSPRSNREIPEYTLPNKNPMPKQQRDKIDEDEVDNKSNSNSEHSGGSDITMKIEDIVEYADA